ncbi:MAG TPA: sugar ABC transporter permease [Fimbriimonas sp.]|nr:sugar ABC transporter permease [Fimbriimonas sp.]
MRSLPSSKLRKWVRKNATGLLFISPWLVGFLGFTLGPFLSSVYLSFTTYDLVHPAKWVGLANYRTLANDDPLFWPSLWVTVKYALVTVPLGIAVGAALALLLNTKVRGQTLFRTIFYLPSIVPSVANAVVFSWILNPQIGLINGILRVFHVEGPTWLNDPIWALRSLMLMSLWGVGGSMVIYLAGLQDIPKHLYEAATIDGTSAAQRMRHITLPLLTPVIFFNLVMGIIGSFQYFTEAFIMTKGGPDGSTLFYALYLFQRAWTYLDMGYACAMAWIVFVIAMVLTGLVFKTQKRWVHFGQ